MAACAKGAKSGKSGEGAATKKTRIATDSHRYTPMENQSEVRSLKSEETYETRLKAEGTAKPSSRGVQGAAKAAIKEEKIIIRRLRRLRRLKQAHTVA